MFNIFNSFKPEIVFHLAAMVSRVTCEISPYMTVDTNLSGLNNIIQLCLTHKSKLIYFSTSEVYGNIGGKLSETRECEPNNLYGLTKYLGEKLVEYYSKDGLKYVTVRPFMFYDENETKGEHRSAMIRFCVNLSQGIPITVHKGSKRSWMYIMDVLPILEKLMFVENETVNIASSEMINTEVLAMIICNILGISYEGNVVETRLPPKMTLDKYPDTNKMETFTGIKATTPVKEGIMKILSELKNENILSI